MSQTESNNAGAGQASYPAAYPSPSVPGMAGASGQYPSYPPSPEGQAHPQASSKDMSSLNLPPIRSVDGRQPPQQAPQHQQPQHAGQPPPIQYYQPYPAHPSDPNQLPLRYPLPPNNSDSRIMSGGRHKKEIKRRTKTGCLTCRKRRIKVCGVSHGATHQIDSTLHHLNRCSCTRLAIAEVAFLVRDRLVATVSSENCYWAIALYLSVHFLHTHIPLRHMCHND